MAIRDIIDANIVPNNNANFITGQRLNTTLKAMCTDYEGLDDAEAEEREAADTTLQGNITAEATARAAADTTLQTNITNEASARAAADTAEATARANADTALGNRVTTIEGKESGWDGKYTKPSGGIPATDMTQAVQTSLGKADTALQSHQDISGKADKVASPTSGDFAGLDANGNLTDSGKKASDFEASGAAASAVSAHNAASDAHASKFAEKQDTISDLATIRSGAAAGATAYQKPATGIPESDLAEAARKVRTAVYGTTPFATIKGWIDAGYVVICMLGTDADMVGYASFCSANKIHFIASGLDDGLGGEIGIAVVANGQGSADVWTYGTFTPEDAANKKTSLSASSTDVDYPSAKCVYDAVSAKADPTPVSAPSTASAYELAVDTMTNLGTLTGAITLTLATAPSDDNLHIYAFTFTAGATAPTITWPSGISWAGGSAPTITAGKSYEVSISQGKALSSEF